MVQDQHCHHSRKYSVVVDFINASSKCNLQASDIVLGKLCVWCNYMYESRKTILLAKIRSCLKCKHVFFALAKSLKLNVPLLQVFAFKVIQAVGFNNTIIESIGVWESYRRRSILPSDGRQHAPSFVNIIVGVREESEDDHDMSSWMSGEAVTSEKDELTCTCTHNKLNGIITWLNRMRYM